MIENDFFFGRPIRSAQIDTSQVNVIAWLLAASISLISITS